MKPVPDDFGLTECGNCAAPLIVHMDGRVEFSGAQESPGELLSQRLQQEVQDGGVIAEQSVAEETHQEQPLEQQNEYQATHAPVATLVEQQVPAEPGASPDLSDIARFGNSDASSGREGSLRYTLYIAGIDTVDVRESFREAITDRKLVWDTDQILRSVKNGEVTIQNVSPAKAYMVVSRLRNLPVQLRWEQYAISQT